MPKSVNSVMMRDTGVSFRSADYQASRPSGQAGPRDKAQGVDAAVKADYTSKAQGKETALESRTDRADVMIVGSGGNGRMTLEARKPVEPDWKLVQKIDA